MTGTLFLLSIAAFVTTELILSRAVRGKKDDASDRGTFWLVWLTWNFAILSNSVVFFLTPREPELWPVNLLGSVPPWGSNPL